MISLTTLQGGLVLTKYCRRQKGINNTCSPLSMMLLALLRKGFSILPEPFVLLCTSGTDGAAAPDQGGMLVCACTTRRGDGG